MLKLLAFSICSCISFLTFAGNGERISNALQTGNTVELSSMFNTSIELITPTTSNVYAREQSKIVLDNFFKMNPPIKATLSHQTNGSQSAMLIFDLITKTGNFRVTVVANTSNGGFVINEFKIE